MIRLTKGDKPAILRRCAATWTRELLEKIANGDKPSDYLRSRYRDKEIKQALILETHGKCAYCESKVLHVAFGDVEHVIPKSKRPASTFEWTNLTLACPICNTNKGDFLGNHDRLVDPYAAEPLDHFYIVGPLIFPKPGDGDASITEAELKLNRGELIERRTERLEALRTMVDNMYTTDDPDLRATLRRDLENNELAKDKEYSAFLGEFYALARRKLDDEQMKIEAARLRQS